MAILCGIDEAGYGPVLGPLVVAATAFRVEGVDPEACARGEARPCLWKALGRKAVLRARPQARGARRDLRLVVCDSKKLYQGGRGIDRMEAGVLAFLANAHGGALRQGANEPAERQEPAQRLLDLLPALGLDPSVLEGYPWYRGLDLHIPHWGFRTEVRNCAERLAGALAEARITALHVAPRIAHPREFNGGVARCGNKHGFEWSIVAALLRALLERYGGEGVVVTVDRLSGREHYGPILAQAFPEARVTAREVDMRRGRAAVRETFYEVRAGERLLVVWFPIEGDDRAFETALASMTAKYFRELFMVPLNRFFEARVPGVRPTAGYYQDGHRFLADIDRAIAELALDRGLLERCC